MSLKICQDNCHVMFSALFVIVYIIIVILVQNLDSVQLNNVTDIHNPHMGIPLKIAFLRSKRPSLRKFVSNKNGIYNHDLLIKNVDKKKYQRDTKQLSTMDPILHHLKHALSKLLAKDNKLLRKRELNTFSGRNIDYTKFKRSATSNSNTNAKWHKWTKWSVCSATCGKGREIRWRHCKENCKGVETEMEEKICQLPACPQKLFGIIKL